MTLLTGNAYFPGGMSEFVAQQNEFLKFEEGPSTDVILQWATYRDASDQCSLSRIWGGIHPPMDDIPGRHIGIVLGPEAFDHARSYFDGGEIVSTSTMEANDATVFPNPAHDLIHVRVNAPSDKLILQLFDTNGKLIRLHSFAVKAGDNLLSIPVSGLSVGVYALALNADGWQRHMRVAIID